MSDFTIRADSVDVEQIMRQIRGRIRDKRGVDYTEEQIRELAAAKLERFLDPTGVRSDLLEQFRTRPTLPPGFLYQFEGTTLFDSDKPIVRFFRRLLHPFLKLLFNPNVLSTTLHKQAAFNQYVHAHQPLQFELLHNLVLELTRASIEVKNLKMRLESVQSRLEFNERRARALEAVVQYKSEAPGRGGGREDRRDPRGEHARGQGPQGRSTGAPMPQRMAQAPSQGRASQGPQPPQVMPLAAEAAVSVEEPTTPGTEPQGGIDPITGGDSLRTRRRRRRRGRRGPGEQGGVDNARAVNGASDSGDAGEAEEGGVGTPDADRSASREVRPNRDATYDDARDNPAPGAATSIPAGEAAAPRTLDPPSAGLQSDTTLDVHRGADSNIRLKPDATREDAGNTGAQNTSSAAVDAAARRTWEPTPAGSLPDATPDVRQPAAREVRLDPDAPYDRDDEKQ
jgi:hypothetical protein